MLVFSKIEHHPRFSSDILEVHAYTAILSIMPYITIYVYIAQYFNYPPKPFK